MSDSISDQHDHRGMPRRIANDSGPMERRSGDVTTSAEARRVLREQGLEAWRQWCREQGATPSA